MTRVPQKEGTRGSLKWIQRAVERRPVLLCPAALPDILWVSPLRSDEFAEYRDAAFLQRMGVGHVSSALADFWPKRGPQWDALGTTPDGGVVIVEAKAHLAEFRSPSSQAGPESKKVIDRSLKWTRRCLGVDSGGDWSQSYYQYANRIAHLCWLRDQGISAHLLFVSFINDSEMGGPADASDWHGAFTEADKILGLPKQHRLSNFVHHVFPDVAELI